MTRRRTRGALATAAAILIAAALAMLPATSASAHDYLVASNPKADSTVTAPLSEVSLTFDDVVIDLDGRGALVQVTDAAGQRYETGCASVSGRTVTTPVALGPSGRYTVTWRIVSADGHPVSDSIGFTWKAPAGSAPAARPTSVACKGDSSSELVSPTPYGAAPPTGASTINPVPIIAVGGGVVLAAIIAVVLILVLSRRRKAEQAEQAE